MKKNIKAILVTVFTILAITIVMTAQDRKDDQPISSTQITAAVNTFMQLAKSGNVADFGIKNIEELKTLKPGKQFVKYMLQLDDIKNYKTGDDINKIIKELASTEIALTDANNRFVTSIEFTKVKGEWQASGFGASTDLKVVYNDRSLIADSSIKNGKLIRVPALHTSFIAVSDATGINFIVTEDNNNLDLKRGAVISADSALLRLKEAAKIYNGLPD